MKTVFEIMDEIYAKDSNLARIAEKVGLPRSTVYRLLKHEGEVSELTRNRILDYYKGIQIWSRANTLRVGHKYKISYYSGPERKNNNGLINGLVIKEYPRYYLIQCKNYKECFLKADLDIKSTRIAELKR